jgi:quinol-cytochrome oxidoreductase complex cytochrome b subunit
MSSTGQFNYAHNVFGIHSVAAAAVFAVLYAVLLPYYIFRAFRNPTYVLIVLSLFCASEF